MDEAGNVYTTGVFAGTADFDPGPDVFNLTSSGELDVFVTKLDSEGDLLWARRFGGKQDDWSTSVAVDPGGNVYTTGYFRDTVDFDPGPAVFNLAPTTASDDMFVSKLDSSGSFVWARRFGGTGADRSSSVAVDTSGNVYTTGRFYGTVDFDPSTKVATLSSAGAEEIFVSKLDSSGSFVWARRMGGTGPDQGHGVTVDIGGNVYTTGIFKGTIDFDPGDGVFELTAYDSVGGFVSKLDSNGGFVWAQQMGEQGSYAWGYGVAVDGTGYVYAAGGNSGETDFDPGVGGTRPSSFVAKLDSAGNLVWARQMGDTAPATGVAVDGAGNVYTAGHFYNIVDFDPGPAVFNLTSMGGNDIFVSKLDSAGNFAWARQMGGTAIARAEGVAVDAMDNVYATGWFMGRVDFDPGPGVYNLNGSFGVFVAKLDNAGRPPAISEVGGGIVLATLLPKIGTISPRSIISVFGQNFSTETILFPNLDGQGKLDTILGGTCLLMNGEVLPIFAVTPTQINAQASAVKSLGPASFQVISNCGSEEAIASAPLTVASDREASPHPQALASIVESVTVEEATPGFFLFPPLAEDGFIAARFNSDSAAVALEGMFTDQFGPSRPAKPGDIIVLYGTGWGETEAELGTGELAVGAAKLLPSASPMVSFGGIPLAAEDVLYVGVTPQAAGLYQLAIRVPAIALPGDNQVVLTVYGKSTPVGPVVPVVKP